MVRCHDNSLYTGITINTARRFNEHKRDLSKASKYLKGKGPLELVFQKRIGEKGLALKLEYKIKGLPKAKKERIVKGLLKLGELGFK